MVCVVFLLHSYILPDASRESGQKTRMVKHSISPTFNHTMVYDGFYTSDLREACAELTVWQKDGIKTRVLGGVRLSCGSGERARSYESKRLSQSCAPVGNSIDAACSQARVMESTSAGWTPQRRRSPCGPP